ncbi:MFS transporter [Vallicoccus soli]|uniref:MFS transporter n=2 Tax=Vallicoccus soli TaxID=2339232 RepID=A0A3A3YVE4_9ACTN|nr:MFS transporter [Vallicoccus soli]
MLSTALVALDSTIIATAVPSIVEDLGGFSQFPWLFSLYLLAQAVSTPVYGRLADVAGRKPVMLAGIGLFLLGSVLCGAAWSMPVLILARAVQGLGAGAVLPMSVTIVGDVYSLEERARVQGYIASVWGISAVVGPTLGGAFSEYVSWRWIFWVNLPLCLVAGLVLHRTFRERLRGERGRVDYLGAGLLSTGCALLILGLLEGGQAWAWASVPSVAVLLGGLVLLAAFVAVQRRVAAPVLPLWVFSRRLLLATSLASVGVGAVVLGLTSYVPTYAQGVLGAGPVTAGLALAALTVGWPLAAAVAGRLYLRYGFRATALLGTALAVAGSALVVAAVRAGSLLLVALACFVVGAGLGFTAVPTLVAAQSSVGWAERGVVTGSNLFSRSLGSALAVAVLGAVANASLGDAPARGAALRDASSAVFVGVLVAAVAMVGAVLAMPRRVAPPAPRESA